MSAAITVVDTADLHSFVKELLFSRYEDRDITAPAAAQVLGISIATLNRWVDAGIIKPIDAGKSERKFNLAYLLSLDLKTLKSTYRQINK